MVLHYAGTVTVNWSSILFIHLKLCIHFKSQPHFLQTASLSSLEYNCLHCILLFCSVLVKLSFYFAAHCVFFFFF